MATEADWPAIDATCRLLTEQIEAMRRAGYDLAERERDRRVAFAKALIDARADGTPAGICKDVVSGRPDVSKAILRRDCAQVLYDTAREQVMATKKQLDTLREQYAREWGEAGRK